MPSISPQRMNRAANGPAPKPTPTSVSKSAWDLSDSIKMLLYGESASGKTTFWATFPGKIKALICSGGRQPGELRSINTAEYRAKIDPVIINSVEEFQAELSTLDPKYKTIVLDHASGLQDIVLKEILGLDDILHAKYRVAGKGESWSVVSQQQYGQLALQCKELLRVLLSLSVNVVIVAQQRTFGEEKVSDIIQPTVGAALTPSVTGWLNCAVDFIVQSYKRQRVKRTELEIDGKKSGTFINERVRGVEYCLRTEPHDVYITKFRRPMGGKELPECVVDPTYHKVISLIGENK